jgi:hypothetical protein
MTAPKTATRTRAVVAKTAPTPKAAAAVAVPASAELEPVQGPQTELEALRAQVAALQAAQRQAAPMAPSYGVNEAWQDLGTLAIPALDAGVRAIPDDSPILGPIDREKVARTVSQWVHHFPVARKDGVKQWPAETLPKPQRSSWK